MFKIFKKKRKIRTYSVWGPVEAKDETLAGLAIKLMDKYCYEKAKCNCQNCLMRLYEIHDDFGNVYPLCDAVGHAYSMSDKRVNTIITKIEQIADEVNHGYTVYHILELEENAKK